MDYTQTLSCQVCLNLFVSQVAGGVALGSGVGAGSAAPRAGEGSPGADTGVLLSEKGTPVCGEVRVLSCVVFLYGHGHGLESFFTSVLRHESSLFSVSGIICKLVYAVFPRGLPPACLPSSPVELPPRWEAMLCSR